MKVQLDAYHMLANMMVIGVPHDVIETVLTHAFEDLVSWDGGTITFAIFCSRINSTAVARVDVMLNVYDDETLGAANEIEKGLRDAASKFDELNLSVYIWRSV